MVQTNKISNIIDKLVKNGKNVKIAFLAIIILLAIFTRFWNLGKPDAFIFDEVYHAFTAKEMLHNNIAAWEWWNTPPEGFAYEWSHPPLAKLVMVLGMQMFGENSYGWRFFSAVFGVGVIIMIILLGKKLFGTNAGLIAGFLATVDGLILVQSRIAMNDIYMLFFVLLAFYLFADIIYSRRSVSMNNILFVDMGILLGLALASKWSAIYALGILAFWFMAFKMISIKELLKKHEKRLMVFKSFLWTVTKITAVFVAIPVIVYLVSYKGFFTSGHTWDKFVELQKQMWWYHTGLKATHSFSSPWWSWPLLLRPVWYWVEYKPGTLANIYAFGNPFIWWTGVAALVYVTGDMLLKMARSFLILLSQKLKFAARLKNIGGPGFIFNKETFSVLFVLSGYYIFILPWAMSPRIMFLYHYLPSLAFLILLMGYVLSKVRNKAVVVAYLILATITFAYFFPRNTGLPVSVEKDQSYIWLKSWSNQEWK